MPPGASDPAGVIVRALGAHGWRAEDVFIAWLLSLDAGMEASVAAADLLAGPALDPLDASQPRRRLRALLEETVGWPDAALARLALPSTYGPWSEPGRLISRR
jgi:hypothetical protein